MLLLSRFAARKVTAKFRLFLSSFSSSIKRLSCTNNVPVLPPPFSSPSFVLFSAALRQLQAFTEVLGWTSSFWSNYSPGNCILPPRLPGSYFPAPALSRLSQSHATARAGCWGGSHACRSLPQRRLVTRSSQPLEKLGVIKMKSGIAGWRVLRRPYGPSWTNEEKLAAIWAMEREMLRLKTWPAADIQSCQLQRVGFGARSAPRTVMTDDGFHTIGPRHPEHPSPKTPQVSGEARRGKGIVWRRN